MENDYRHRGLRTNLQCVDVRMQGWADGTLGVKLGGHVRGIGGWGNNEHSGRVGRRQGEECGYEYGIWDTELMHGTETGTPITARARVWMREGNTYRTRAAHTYK